MRLQISLTLVFLFAHATAILAQPDPRLSSSFPGPVAGANEPAAPHASPLARGSQPLASGIPTLTDWGIGALLICLMSASMLSFRRALLDRRWPDDALNASGRRPNLDRRLL